MQRDEFDAIMSRLTLYCVDVLVDDVARAYFNCLVSLSAEALDAAVDRHLVTAKDEWLPTPGRLLCLAREAGFVDNCLRDAPALFDRYIEIVAPPEGDATSECE